MPLTHPRRIAEWQARFNRVCRDHLEPALGSRGYRVTVDQVSEEVEPDSLGPFYVGEVGLTRPLAGGRYAHLVIQSTTQPGKPVESLTVDLYRDRRSAPPSWPAGAPDAAEYQRRVGRTTEPARVDSSIWEFRNPDDLRQRLAELVDRLTAAPPAGRSLLDEAEAADDGTGSA